MANIHLPKPETPQVNRKKEGDSYDRCPNDDCVEVDPTYRFGGKDGKGEQYQNWALYTADVRQGGCGHNWARTTKAGLARDHARGVHPKWLSQSALVDRTVSLPSDRYRANYALIDWSR